MSDTEATPAKVTKPLGGIKEGNFAGMPQQDVDFLVACLKSSVGGSIVVRSCPPIWHIFIASFSNKVFKDPNFSLGACPLFREGTNRIELRPEPLALIFSLLTADFNPGFVLRANLLIGLSQVNTIKVAELLEYKNHRSVTNRIKQMKDKYGLFMSGSTKVSVEPTEGDEEDAAEETPAKLMTPKAAAKPKAVKTPASSGKKQPAKAKAPVAKKRKIEEVEFPGLEPNGDADAASSAIEEEA